MSKQLATLFSRLLAQPRNRRKTNYRPSCERMENRALMCATLLEAPAPVDPTVENTKPSEIALVDTEFAANIQIANNFEASSWGWIELTEGANTDGYEHTTNGRGDYHVVELNGVQHDGQTLEGDYWVTIYVQGQDEPIKKEVTFENGNATLHTGVSVNNDLKITKVGVSTPPTAAGLGNDDIGMDEIVFVDPTTAAPLFDTPGAHTNASLPNDPVNRMMEVELQVLELTGQPLGVALSTATDDHLVVSNIGSSGEDGVLLDPIDSSSLPRQKLQLDSESVGEAFSDDSFLNSQDVHVAPAAFAYISLWPSAPVNGYALGTTRAGHLRVINLSSVTIGNRVLNGTYTVHAYITVNGKNQTIQKQVTFNAGNGTLITDVSVNNNLVIRSVLVDTTP